MRSLTKEVKGIPEYIEITSAQRTYIYSCFRQLARCRVMRNVGIPYYCMTIVHEARTEV